MSEQALISDKFYRLHTIPLNAILTDKEIALDSRFVYFASIPIALELKINEVGADLLPASSIQILRAPEREKIRRIFVTTTTTSSDSLKIITSDVDIFSDIGIEDRAVLVDPDGVEYDARNMRANDGSNWQNTKISSDGALVTLIQDKNSGTQADVSANSVDELVSTIQGLATLGFNYELSGQSSNWDRIRHSRYDNNAGITTNGTGSGRDLRETTMSLFTLHVVRTAGSSAYIVTIEGSLDASNWETLGTLTASGASKMIHVVDKPVNLIRYNVTDVGSGNTLTVGTLASAR